ncbi:hypothetical protein FC770_08105 [Nocardioides jishulii]|uniref:Integral membrane protein n=1 Tax=Nocardioides jishulii TaxID=2575440 RepID=A0A4U2YNB5_9ACTN|nr:hypothetical protein FCL41_08440 [Nocardioides jishulii]TKI62777.1 hypothetical protein FC770_08105 [Nocardioides jishulii]
MARQDVESLLAARGELGVEYESALVESFTERVERAVAERSEQAAREINRRRRADDSARIRQFALGVVSLVVGVPITIVPIVAPDDPSLAGVVVAWLGIVGVNVAHARSIRPRSSGPAVR